MYTLAPDEKATMVMVYSHNALIRGQVVTKENLRVSTWLRTEGAPEYLHILNAQVLLLSGSPFKSLSYSELFFPTGQAIAFHMLPPISDTVDYDPSEQNRMMAPVTILVGTFTIRGHLRISTQTDIGTNLEVGHTIWTSIYDADISNPYLPVVKLQVPLIIVRSEQVGFGLE
ncbi:MAG: hypothetical protein JXB85_09100 [Anaerolineales bacterium]|nr:hypothetical protein [Anaerolineales bacterium]